MLFFYQIKGYNYLYIEKNPISRGGFFTGMKIMSNELLVAAYRDAKKNEQESEWIRLLKSEMKKRGLKP